MKILIVSQYFWPENFRINDLAAGLAERGHDLTVLTGLPNYPEGAIFKGYGIFSYKTESYHGVKVLRVPLVPRGSGRSIRLSINYISFVVFGSLLAPFLCRDSYQAILIFAPSPITAALPALVIKKIRAIPTIMWIQDLWPENISATGAISSPWLLGKIRKMVHFIYHRCDKLLVSSRAFIEPVESYGIEKDRIGYLPQFAENVYRPMAPPMDGPEYDLVPDGFIVMFAGNIGVAQDFATILSAAERLKAYPEIHWVIVGDGRQRSWVSEQIQSRGLVGTVHLVGRFPLESMPRFFSLADLMLVSLNDSPIFSLTIPGKVQSYLACGKPIIAVLDGEGSRVIREAGAGFTCPAGDHVGLAEAVLAMYRLPEDRRREMGESGLLYHREHFERSLLLDRLEGWLHEAAEGGS